MAAHAQNVDQSQFISDAATHIESGRGLDNMARLQAAGHAAQQAADTDDTDFLDLLILVGAGKYAVALHKLVDMSLQNNGAQAAPASPFANLINPPTGNAGPAVPTPPPAQPATGRPGRRNR